ncbi:hypothetical protein AB0I22_20175 [Streptomyces sp. NPDC050610]|uniref:hypothetical protein n=1 Tax=Streptomyces sp. NPDC050610 TaxID=3157097 RepID=UPI0034314117
MDTDSTKTKTAKTDAETGGPADETPLASKKGGAEDAAKEKGADGGSISEVTETGFDADTDADGQDADGKGADGQDSAESEEDALAEETAARPASSGVFAGAAAVVSAALGFAALSGTWLGTLLAERKTLTGQIKVQSGGSTDQIGAVYGAPWHTTALVNGGFALIALLLAAAVLASRPRTSPAGPLAPWVRAVAWGGVALGVIGVLISAGMYFDLFGALPKVPATSGR